MGLFSCPGWESIYVLGYGGGMWSQVDLVLSLWLVLGTKSLWMRLYGWFRGQNYSGLGSVGCLWFQFTVDRVMLAICRSQTTGFGLCGWSGGLS